MKDPAPDLSSRLRRDLGTFESYAALIGILIGAGIFQVTSQAWALTGPSVILGYLILTPAILATSIPYAAYLSTPLGREPGGEYLHISRTLNGFRLAYVGAWLKIISYIGAGAFLGANSNGTGAASISITDARSAVWFLSDPPASLPEEVAATGALVLTPTGDPMAELVKVQRLAVDLAAARGLDPDRPRNLSRSVVLPSRSG